MIKKIIMAAVCSLFSISISAQVVKGDMNGDGKITMADANEIANTYLGEKAVQTLPVYQQGKIDAMLDKVATNLRTINRRFAAIQENIENIGEQHEYVDLGLPSGTLWAKTNVGAEKETDYGDYFAWGETEGYDSGKTTFDWSTYTLCNGTYSTMTRYCTVSTYGTVDSKTELEANDDAATANWGSNWCMPSFDQIKELYNTDNTTTTWTTIDGVYGRKITSNKNGKYIFLPAAGYRENSSLSTTGTKGYYWSRTLHASYSCYAYTLCIGSTLVDWGFNYRNSGRSVRPVRIKK